MKNWGFLFVSVLWYLSISSCKFRDKIYAQLKEWPMSRILCADGTHSTLNNKQITDPDNRQNMASKNEYGSLNHEIG